MNRTPINDSIGTASLDEDGTLRLVLRLRKETRFNFATSLTIKPDNPRYKSYMDHIGPLSYGERKDIPPWRA